MDVLESTNPPTVNYFKSLPTQSNNVWAVYLIALEKSGFPPKIYIGSGTDKDIGVRARLMQYERLKMLPRFAHNALLDGYAIVHTGLPCWTPIPTALQRHSFRVLLLALEATFTWGFWAMYSYQWIYMHSLCRWPIESLKYTGCCSHSSLSEKVLGDTSNLTPEQILAVEEQRMQTARDYQAAYYQERKKLNPEGWLASRRASEKAYKARVMASSKHTCGPCNRLFESSKDKKRHDPSDVHIAKVVGVRKTVKHPTTQARGAANKASKRY